MKTLLTLEIIYPLPPAEISKNSDFESHNLRFRNFEILKSQVSKFPNILISDLEISKSLIFKFEYLKISDFEISNSHISKLFRNLERCVLTAHSSTFGAENTHISM